MKKQSFYITILAIIFGIGLFAAGVILKDILYMFFGFISPVILSLASVILFNEN